MRTPKVTKHSAVLLEDLRHAVHGINAPFACGGTFLPDSPIALCFKDQTPFPVQRASNAFEQERQLAPLIQQCTPAPFGRGRQTRFNRTVRDALQLKAEGGAFSVSAFDPQAAGILEHVRRELLPHDASPLTAELYSLNIYARDGHFVPHKDTPRGSDMVGTLVVCLPSQFSNGALVVKHHGILQTFDWARDIESQKEPTRLHWAAFFGDVDHQIERVWFGLRVTLTYLLRRGDGSDPLPTVSPEVQPSLVQDQLRTMLADRQFLPKGGTLAFPCSHLYHQDSCFQRQQRPLSNRTVSTLKGRDAMVAAAALAAGLEVTFCPYLVETCADQTWQLGRFPSPKDQRALDDRLDPDELERALDVRAGADEPGDFGLIWVDPAPHFNGQPTMYPGASQGQRAPLDPELPAIAHLHECEYSATGYFGNEGSETDFYTYGALHVVIPPYGEGPRHSSETRTTQQGTAPAPRKRSSRKKTVAKKTE
jgi:hypothetical protein